MFERSKVAFWNEIAVKINQELDLIFTEAQCKDKFKSLVHNCKVSKN